MKKAVLLTLCLGSMFSLQAGQNYQNRSGQSSSYNQDDSSMEMQTQTQQRPRGSMSHDTTSTSDDAAATQANDRFANESDRELGKKIREQLKGGWFSKNFENFSLQINNGNVTLRGAVDSSDDKNTVEERIRKVEGIKNLNLQVTIREEGSNRMSDRNASNPESRNADRTSSSNDSQIAAQIRARLQDRLANANQVTIRVSNGTVTLEGTVSSQDDKQTSTTEARKVKGVSNVNNQLQVTGNY